MTKLMKTSLALAFAAGVMSVGSAGVAEAAGKRFIAIGTGGPTGVYFATGNAICRLVHKEAAEGRSSGRKHGIRCSAPSTGGSTYNIGQVMENELDFGVAQADWQYHAYNGSSSFKDKGPRKKLRAVFSVHGEPFHIVVGKDSGINSWDDLKGKRVNIGNVGSGQRGTMDMLMKKAGWSKKDFKAATELTSTEQSKALCDGKIDAFVYTIGVPNAGVAVATDGCDARIINFENALTKSVVTSANPFYSWLTVPKGTYKTTDKTVTSFGPRATFVTSADVPADVVYEVVRAVFENIDDFRGLHPAFANLDPKQMVSDGLSAPLHPGALKYYKEKGLK